MQKKGFTLVELLVVIAIIGLLSTIAVVSLGNSRSKAVATKAAADLRSVQSANEIMYTNTGFYQTVNGAWPTNFGDAMPSSPTSTNNAAYHYCVSADAKYYLFAASEMPTGVKPAGLSAIQFSNPSAARCGLDLTATNIDCSLETVYCLTNTTSISAFL